MQRPNRIAGDEALASTRVFVLNFVRVYGGIFGRWLLQYLMLQLRTLQLRTLQHHGNAQTFLTGRLQRKSIVGAKQ